MLLKPQRLTLFSWTSFFLSAVYFPCLSPIVFPFTSFHFTHFQITAWKLSFRYIHPLVSYNRGKEKHLTARMERRWRAVKASLQYDAAHVVNTNSCEAVHYVTAKGMEINQSVSWTFLTFGSIERADGSEGLKIRKSIQRITLVFWKTMHVIITIMTPLSDRGHNVWTKCGFCGNGTG